MSSKIKALVCRVGAEPVVEEREDVFESWQKLVGGWIEVVRVEGGVFLLCNEEGLLLGLPYNRDVARHHIHGDFALVRDDAEGDFASLTDVDVETWTRRLSAVR